MSGAGGYCAEKIVFFKTLAVIKFYGIPQDDNRKAHITFVNNKKKQAWKISRDNLVLKNTC